MHRLVSYFHWNPDLKLACWVGDEVKYIKMVLFCDAPFAGDLNDSKSTGGVYLALIGPSTYVPFKLCGYVIK